MKRCEHEEEAGEIEKYDGNLTVVFSYAYSDKLAIGTKLFTRPPITSKRELALLAVIEQKDAAIELTMPLLIAVSRGAHFLLDNTEEFKETYTAQEEDVFILEQALDILDTLPENLDPNLVMTGTAKAEWILNKALALTPESALKEHDAKVLESAARCCEKIAYERFAEYGTTETDTGAGYYTGLDSEERDIRDEEDNACADAIRRMAEERRKP